MNYEFFLAKRILLQKQDKGRVSTPIIKIAISAIALGVIIMLISIATGIGLQHKIRDKISGFNGHIQITNFDEDGSDLTVSPINTKQNFYPKFTSVNGIRNIQIYATKGGVIRTDTDFQGVIVKGVSKDYDWEFFKSYLVKGNLPNFNTTKKSSEALISKRIANKMNLNLGEKFNTVFVKDNPSKPPIFRVFTVTGIYNTGFNDFDENYILADLRHLQKLNKWTKDQVGGFEILIDDFTNINQKSKEIYKEIPSDLYAQSIVKKFPGIFQWIKLFDTNIYLIIGLMTLVAGVNIITALLVLILERTQMIGVLKAMGASNWSIRKVFLYNTSYLILRGLFWGNLIGIGLLLLQHYFGIIKLDPETYYVKQAPVYINVVYIVLLNIGTLLLCYLMMIVPSLIISKISPVKAIKFQ